MRKSRRIMSLVLALALVFGVMSGALSKNSYAASDVEYLMGIWSGAYVGQDSNKVPVNRNIIIEVTSVNGQTGQVSGIAEFNTPSDSSGHGKYYFDGNYNFQTKEFIFQGNDWIERPTNFIFAKFYPTLNISEGTLYGSVDKEAGRIINLNKITNGTQNLGDYSWAGDWYMDLEGDVVHFPIIQEDSTIKCNYMNPDETEGLFYGLINGNKMTGKFFETGSEGDITFEMGSDGTSFDFYFESLDGEEYDHMYLGTAYRDYAVAAPQIDAYGHEIGSNHSSNSNASDGIWNGVWIKEDGSRYFEIEERNSAADGHYIKVHYNHEGESGLLMGDISGNTIVGTWNRNGGRGDMELVMASDHNSFEFYYNNENSSTMQKLGTFYRDGAGQNNQSNQNNQNQGTGRAKNDLSSGRAKNDNPLVDKVQTVVLPDLHFSDLSKDHWAYEYVQLMNALGIISGYPDGTFRPNGTFSRAAFAKLLSLSYGLDPYEGSDVVYADVTSNDWFYTYVMAAEQIEAINYYSESDGSKTYRPNNPSEREDVAVALVTLLGLNPEEANLSLIADYKDLNQISDDMKKYVALAYEHGIMTGNSEGYFMPHEPLTRAQACAVFARVLIALSEL